MFHLPLIYHITYTILQSNSSFNSARRYTLGTKLQIVGIKFSLYRFGSLIWMRSAVRSEQSICETIHSRACVLSCTQTHALSCIMQIYWLSTSLCAHTHLCGEVGLCGLTYTRSGTLCLAWQTATTQLTSLYLPSDVPCVLLWLSYSPPIPSFSFLTLIQVYPAVIPPPLSLPAATNHSSRKTERTEGDGKKEWNRKC